MTAAQDFMRRNHFPRWARGELTRQIDAIMAKERQGIFRTRLRLKAVDAARIVPVMARAIIDLATTKEGVTPTDVHNALPGYPPTLLDQHMAAARDQAAQWAPDLARGLNNAW